MMHRKHVIFLGAGASKSSGYPLANELALLMADRRLLAAEILRQADLIGEEWQPTWLKKSTLSSYLNQASSATGVLREGAFATMDELGRLSATGVDPSTIQVLKKLMRLVLSMYNPHLNSLRETDYRPFIQALFGGTSRIRNDVAVVSFNYDPYLEYALRQAFQHRQSVNPLEQGEHGAIRNAITSGFENPDDLSWLSREGFCHLKLHGACVFSGRPDKKRKMLPLQPGDDLGPQAGDMFEFTTLFGKLCAMVGFDRHEPPAIMPWEIVHEEGRLLSEQEFRTAVGETWQHRERYALFAGLWQRAHREVLQAGRISFVGLSMNRLLEPAFRFLFNNKDGRVAWCVANPETGRYSEKGMQMHPRSPCGRAHALLQQIVEPTCEFSRTANDLDANVPLLSRFKALESDAEPEPEITAYKSFADFIESEVREP